MYCPTCAAQNIDNAQFCRACGADISFLSMPVSRRQSEKSQKESEQGLRYSFIGGGFLVIAILMLFAAPPPANWALCFSMLCAAFPLLGSGVAKILSAKKDRQQSLGPAMETRPELKGPSIAQLPSPNTSEMVKPPSVTEGTTKILRDKVE
jgi:zinc-ribbon domain